MTEKIDKSQFNAGHRIFLLLFNCFPLLHVSATVAVTLLPFLNWWQKILSAVLILYIMPPILGRILKTIFPIKEGKIPVGSRDFFVWWLLANMQMLFCRLPFLEEILRLFPGIYTAWLRIWGARIGKLTYWSAGTMILDRQFIEIGDLVVFGAAVRINPHVLALNDEGKLELILATVKIGDGAVVGGYSLLTAGTEIAAGECTKAFLISSPFSRWEAGARTNKTGRQTE